MVRLSEGNGGSEMDALIRRFTKDFPRGTWENCDNDAATLRTDIGIFGFTTDSFIVEPPFFPGGNIGDLAVCGTINDLAVMGIIPSALSLSLVIEEGFPDEDLEKISKTIASLSKKTDIPIVTGDTKVMQKGKLDRIMINTSAIGVTDTILDKQVSPGDLIILSGSLGDHAVAVLSKRFEFKTAITTDSKPLIEEVQAIKHLIKQAKDPTRGGLASALNDLASRNSVQFLIKEDRIPVKQEVKSAVDLLGIDIYSLACEGRLLCIASQENADETLETLRTFNPEAAIIGEVTDEKKSDVVLQTKFGRRLMPKPSGNIVPRIC